MSTHPPSRVESLHLDDGGRPGTLAGRLYRESLEIGWQLRDTIQTAFCLGGLAAVAASRGATRTAARLWGGVHGLETTSGTVLHAPERDRYERMIAVPGPGHRASDEFDRGRRMDAGQLVEYALTLD